MTDNEKTVPEKLYDELRAELSTTQLNCDMWHDRAEDMRNRLSAAQADNAKLREEIEAAKHDLQVFSMGSVQLDAENAKLRELVEDMHAALQAFCDAQDVHGDNCPLWVERTDDCELRGIERRMRELGVEVD